MRSQPPFTVGQSVELQIERLASGGLGVGRVENFVVFVPFSAPGERLCAQITEIKKSYAIAQMEQVLEPSPMRVQAPCPVFGTCGGCSLQHVAYEEQLRQKEEIVRSEIKKQLGVNPGAVEPIQASPDSFRYRNRVQIRVDRGRLGFFARHSHQVVDIQDCLISDERLVREFPRIREEFKNQTRQVKLELALQEDGSVHHSTDRAHGEEMGFSQVNRRANELLVQYVIHLFNDFHLYRVFDLYCGKGNFSFRLAMEFPASKIIGVEANPQSVASAQSHLREYGSTHFLEFHAADVASFLRAVQARSGTAVLLDPPRTGCAPEVISELVRLRPEVLVYVSCNPSTFARDARELIKHDFQIQRVKPFDLFPQTDHVELVAVFERSAPI